MEPDTRARFGRLRRWIYRLFLLVIVLIAMAVGALECLARRINIEKNDNGTSVMEPRGFFSRANAAGFMRIGKTQWVDAADRKECFTVGQGCSITGSDPDRDGKIDEIYVLLRDEAITPYLRGYDRDLGGLRLFVELDSTGTPHADEESLTELHRVIQALMDDGMQRYAEQFERDGG